MPRTRMHGALPPLLMSLCPGSYKFNLNMQKYRHTDVYTYTLILAVLETNIIYNAFRVSIIENSIVSSIVWFIGKRS